MAQRPSLISGRDWGRPYVGQCRRHRCYGGAILRGLKTRSCLPHFQIHHWGPTGTFTRRRPRMRRTRRRLVARCGRRGRPDTMCQTSGSGAPPGNATRTRAEVRYPRQNPSSASVGLPDYVQVGMLGVWRQSVNVGAKNSLARNLPLERIALSQVCLVSSSSLLLSSLESSDTHSLSALNTSPPRNRCTFL